MFISNDTKSNIFVTTKNLNELAHYQSFFTSYDPQKSLWELEYEFYNEFNAFTIDILPYHLNSCLDIDRVVISETNSKQEQWKAAVNSSQFQNSTNILKEKEECSFTFEQHTPPSLYDEVENIDGYLLQKKDARFLRPGFNCQKNCLTWGCHYDTHTSWIEIYFKEKNPNLIMFDIPPKTPYKAILTLDDLTQKYF